MSEFQSVLINKLAHQLKNELTTLRLALFNLSHLLQETPLPDERGEQSQEFLSVIRTTLSQSIESLSKILLVTRSGNQYFKIVNLTHILFEIVDQPEYKRFFRSQSSADHQLVNTDPQTLQLAFTLLFEHLIKNAHHENIKGEIYFHKKSPPEIRILFPVKDSEELKIVQADSPKSAASSAPLQLLLLKRLLQYLDISFSVQQNAENSAVILTFNQIPED
ncbi:MAG: hypothetical protein GXO77_05105 [Calditrichaeota bacterium]|nr:hypothetical protein [Calditrichota bacterium]